ncbi:MAG: BrnA antitoxin family protein [Acidobacteriota bacterium]|nr:BrnA antitoxin family protein [Acidobacteriota bacterium]
MKKQEKNSTSKTMRVEYTEQDIEEMREQPHVSEDELPQVGVHEFRRSKFVTKRSDQKIKVSLYLDADVLDFFNELAAQPDSATYQTHINNELRAAMKRGQSVQTDVVTLKMLENPKFLSALAEKLKNAA